MSVVWKENRFGRPFLPAEGYAISRAALAMGWRRILMCMDLLFHEIFHWNFQLWNELYEKNSCENTAAWKLNVPSEIISTHFALSQKLGRLTHSFFYLTKASSVFAKESNIPARLTFEFSTQMFYRERSKFLFKYILCTTWMVPYLKILLLDTSRFHHSWLLAY